MWGSVWQDLRHTVRGLMRSPGFTLSAVVTLAVGIGANTAIFSVVHGVLMKPLPYDDPEALVQIRETTNRGGTMRVAWANFLDWHEESRSFQALAAYGVGTTTVLGGDRPLSIPVAKMIKQAEATLKDVLRRDSKDCPLCWYLTLMSPI